MYYQDYDGNTSFLHLGDGTAVCHISRWTASRFHIPKKNHLLFSGEASFSVILTTATTLSPSKVKFSVEYSSTTFRLQQHLRSCMGYLGVLVKYRKFKFAIVCRTESSVGPGILSGQSSDIAPRPLFLSMVTPDPHHRLTWPSRTI
jgi:hypothetical protein